MTEKSGIVFVHDLTKIASELYDPLHHPQAEQYTATVLKQFVEIQSRDTKLKQPLSLIVRRFIKHFTSINQDPIPPVVTVLTQGGALIEGWQELSKRKFLDRAVLERRLQLWRLIEEESFQDSYYVAPGGIPVINQRDTLLAETKKLDEVTTRLRERSMPSLRQMRK